MAPSSGLGSSYVRSVTRVTVVDDERDICELVQFRLTTMGMDVDVYFDGESGLKAIEADPPDLAIIDVMMPKMNGLEVTRAIRANPAIENLPIIVFTALGRPEDQEAGHEAGTDYYVIKPFSVLALGAYVEKILGLRVCAGCGKRRGVNALEFSPEQVLQHSELGWVVTVDGDVCGECHVIAFESNG
jgi:DNA-binding response OmpR family regulator